MQLITVRIDANFVRTSHCQPITSGIVLENGCIPGIVDGDYQKPICCPQGYWQESDDVRHRGRVILVSDGAKVPNRYVLAKEHPRDVDSAAVLMHIPAIGKNSLKWTANSGWVKNCPDRGKPMFFGTEFCAKCLAKIEDGVHPDHGEYLHYLGPPRAICRLGRGFDPFSQTAIRLWSFHWINNFTPDRLTLRVVSNNCDCARLTEFYISWLFSDHTLDVEYKTEAGEFRLLQSREFPPPCH